MYVSIQTVCGCHGYLLFESIHCDRCRSMIPFQLTDESLIDSVSAKESTNPSNVKQPIPNKQATTSIVPYHKHHSKMHQFTTGHVRFRTLCPFCNSPTYVLRYFCKRERTYYHLRVQHFGENEQSIYKSIAETQHMDRFDKNETKTENSTSASVDDSASLTGSASRPTPSTIVYDQTGIPNAREIQIKNEKHLYPFNDIEGDLFEVLRNGLFFDTILQCQDGVKIQTHRCILGGRSPWFRNLINEHHNPEAEGEYILQISIDDVQSDVMNEILNFIYTNRCVISLRNASNLLIVAKRFGLPKLSQQIGEFLLFRLTTDNALDMLVSAHESDSEVLKLACIRLINRNAEKIKRTEKWRTFKNEYVDLVPELYENRIERPPHVQQAFLPDVFTAPVVVSDGLQKLSKLYENPVKQRVPSPKPRTLPPPKQRSKPIAQNSTFHPTSHSRPRDTIAKEATGPFPHRNTSGFSSVYGNDTPVNRHVRSHDGHRPMPPQATGPPLTRNVYPAVKQNSQTDNYRRPVNIYGKNGTQPPPNQKQKPPQNQLTPKRHSQTPTNRHKSMSPKHMVAVHRSPSFTDASQEEHITLARVISPDMIE